MYAHLTFGFTSVHKFITDLKYVIKISVVVKTRRL